MNSASIEKKRRYDKYMAFIEDQDSISIQYLAEATNTALPVVMSDVREMAAMGYFGKTAYVNHLEKTLVLKNEVAGKSAMQHRAAPAAVSKNAWEAIRPRMLPLLLVGGIALLVWGAYLVFSTIDVVTVTGLAAAGVWGFIKGGLLLTGGGVLLGVRGAKKGRYERCRKLLPHLQGKEPVQLGDLATAYAHSKRKIRSDITYLMEKGLLGHQAQLDSRREIFYPVGFPKQEKETAPKTEGEKSEDRVYEQTIRQIRQLNEAIQDPVVSGKIDQIEGLTAKIFKIVEEKPEKQGEIKTFMNYYLPATLKLLHSYSVLERQGIEGENIDGARERIESILDKLVSGFTQQLDQLFRADALDISSDIDVLETMMQRDGLTGDGSAFAVEGK